MRAFLQSWGLGFLFILASLNGCAAVRFESIPTTTADFDLSQEAIRERFSDVARYDKKFTWPFKGFPSIHDLVTKWGEPTQIKNRWDYFGGLGVGGGLAAAVYGVAPAATAVGVGVAISPYPAKEYFWVKGAYCIKARVVRMFYHFYRPVIAFWEWRTMDAEGSSTCTMPNNALEATRR